jgi:hypothetical protein
MMAIGKTDDQMTRSTIDVIATTEMAHRVSFLAAKLHYRALDSVKYLHFNHIATGTSDYTLVRDDA